MSIRCKTLPHLSEKDKSRFWRGAQIGLPNDCWNYRTLNKRGYGYFCFPVVGKYNSFPAHRIAYAIVNGEILEGSVICHDCDNPACVNPKHLTQGTQRKNIQDAGARRRMKHGESHGCARLTEKQVLQIKSDFMAGETTGQIARRLGFAPANIRAILNRQSWKHVIHPDDGVIVARMRARKVHKYRNLVW